MTYIQQSLAPEERLVHIGRFHWLYTLAACMSIFWGLVTAVAIIAGAIFIQLQAGGKIGLPLNPNDPWWAMVWQLHPGVKIVALLFFVFGLMKFASMMIIRFSTEIAVTSARIIYKRGLVARYVGEMSIDRIEGVSVYQSVMGRLFDFGNIIIRGLGVGEVILPPIRDPIKFRRAIEYARTIGEKNGGKKSS
jgi:hypothetical protein